MFLSLSLVFDALLFTVVALNAIKSSILLDRDKCQPQAWWSSELEGVVKEKHKAFVSAHRSNEERQPLV